MAIIHHAKYLLVNFQYICDDSKFMESMDIP